MKSTTGRKREKNRRKRVLTHSSSGENARVRKKKKKKQKNTRLTFTFNAKKKYTGKKGRPADSEIQSSIHGGVAHVCASSEKFAIRSRFGFPS